MYTHQPVIQKRDTHFKGILGMIGLKRLRCPVKSLNGEESSSSLFPERDLRCTSFFVCLFLYSCRS